MLTRNGRIRERIHVKIPANSDYPAVEAELLRGDLADFTDRVEVRVLTEPFVGAIWNLSVSEVEVKACVSNTTPDSHDSASTTPDFKELTSEPTPEKEVRVYAPGVSPKRLRRELALGNGNLAEGGKGFGANVWDPWSEDDSGSASKPKPKRKKRRLILPRAVEKLQEYLDDTTQEIDSSLRVHVDWIQGVGVCRDLDRLFLFLANVMGEEVFYEPNSPRKMGTVWKHSGRCLNGFAFLANERSEQDGGGFNVWVSFPGELMSSRSVRHWWKVCKGLRRLIGFRATRMDVALDDYDKSVDLNLVREAILAGNVRGLKLDSPKSYKFIDSAKGGWTTYLGAPKSASGLRVYDKDAESGGTLPCHRWEQQLRADYASQALDDWLRFGSKGFEQVSASYLGGLVVGRYVFIDRAAKPNEKNLSRIPELPWWKAFVDRVGCQVKHARKRPKFSIERKMNWVIRQVITSLVVLEKVMGTQNFDDWLRKQMARAEQRRLTPWHWHQIQTFGAELDSFAA